MNEHMNYQYNVDLKESKSEQAIEKMNEQANDLLIDDRLKRKLTFLTVTINIY